MSSHQRIVAPRIGPASPRAAAAAPADYGLGDQPDWRAVQWPAHLRAMTIAARRVHVVEIGSGSGTPIVLLHGLGGRWQTWLENIPRLAANRRVVAIDLPGFGRSQLPLEPISIAGYAAAVERVCDLLEFDAVTVVGHSLGALVAAELALREPQRVAQLALVSAACLGPGRLGPKASELALTAVGRITTALPHGAASTLTRPRLRRLAFAAVIRHPTLIATDTLYELTGGVRPPGTLRAFAALNAHDISAQLSAIAVPVMIVHGRHDLIVAASDAEQLAALIPAAELLVFEDTGHLPMLERPIAFNDELLRFAGGLPAVPAPAEL